MLIMTKTIKWRIAANIFIVLATVTGLLMMFFWKYGMLLADGLTNFRYFTVLSNVFGGVTAAVWLVSAAICKGKAEDIPRAVELLKYMAAVSLGLTFITVMGFFGPLYGYLNMLMSANFFFHLTIPLAAMAEFILLNQRKMSMKNCIVSMLPMLLYGTAYLTYNLMMGKSEDPFQYDWYGFLLWGLPVGMGIFAGICAVTFLVGTLLRLLNKKIRQL